VGRRKPKQKDKIKRVDMSDAEVEALLSKAACGPLSMHEIDRLRDLVATLQFVTGELEKKRVSVQRLKRMLFGASTEKTSNAKLNKLLAGDNSPDEILDELTRPPAGLPPAKDTGEPTPADTAGAAPDAEAALSTRNPDASPEPGPEKPNKAPGHGRRGASEYRGGQQVPVGHPSIKHKDPCPACDTGKLYRQKTPKVLVRLTGAAPINATVFSIEWFRCGTCGHIETAPLPTGAGPPEKYDASATSTIAAHRYGYGMPFTRLAQIQENVKIPLPAGTQWQLVNDAANNLESVFLALMRKAAYGEVLHNDDTTARILELMAARNKGESAARSKDKERVGVFTTGIVSVTQEHQIALYTTGHQHAGENLRDLLQMCASEQRTAIQMSDGLSLNEPAELPEGLALIACNCLAHGRRKYVEVVDSFPEQCLHVLVELQKVYKADREARVAKMTVQERLAHHQQHSRPVMDALETWLKQQLDEKLVEPNSSFGEATTYMLKRWERLTRFLNTAGAPLDNNICERALKRSIRHRKNSLFYKTIRGARVGDIYMSLIHTCELNDINPFDYLTALVAQGERLNDDPESWLPCNYAARAGSNGAAATV